MLSEHAYFMDAISAGVTEAVGTFQALAVARERAERDGTEWFNTFHVMVFDIAWQTLRETSSLLMLWPPDWPSTHFKTSLPALLSALDKLLVWLLCLTRGQSMLLKEIGSELLASLTENGSLQDKLLHTLQPVVWCVSRLVTLDAEQLIEGVMLLPPSFLSKVCCLMCECLRCGNLPDCTTQDTRKRVLTQSVVGLATAIGDCIKVAAAVPGDKMFLRVGDAMLCPAVLQLAKLSLVICSKVDTTMCTNTDLLNLVHHVENAQGILSLGPSMAQQPGSIPVSKSAGQHPQGKQGRHAATSSSSSQSSSNGVLTARDLVPRVTTSDLELIYALQDCAQPWTDAFLGGLSVMLNTVIRWEGPKASKVAPAVKAACLQAVLHHVSKHTHGRMLLLLANKECGQDETATPLHAQTMAKLRLVMAAALKSIKAMDQGG